ncbi:BMP family lipoprotein [Paenibacillus physcomitrellae]|uniref:BMP family ABC transporter substrate-binding protein n=1 Tax=Paenibacillus physcomitrellae TaxID=1619311 RepID=A0ABQ1G7B1_9BACL|nr:BMP family ABC transporter substrate-binding protein [Paenibacillus physcomitrellae]GGA38122.1 BMP family ABC transporter substrate-binding protein [Paenibacillus physcomitrellae]
MKKSFKLSIVLLLALTVVLAGCGNNKNNANAGNSASGGSNSNTAASVKVGLVTDVGGVNDKSFNQSAWEGLSSLSDVKSEYLQSTKPDDYQTNLNKFVKGGYDLTWGIGMDLGDAVDQVASENPNAKLAIIDATVDQPNVKSVTFSENEGSFLVGVVAGMMTKTNKIGFVGGSQIPVIERFEAGFKAGIAAVNPNAQVLVNYTGAFDKPDLGKTAAATFYDNGADIVFQAAGGTGTGVFNEATARVKSGQKVWVIGVDKDQSLEFGDEVTLTSMVKRVDEAVKRVSQEVVDGTFKGGSEVLGLKENGVGIADTSEKNVPADVLAKVEEYKQKIINGEITVPAEPTK